MRGCKLATLILFSLTLCTGVWGSELLAHALEQEKQGNRREAIDLYSQWLTIPENLGYSGNVLLHAAGLHDVPDEALVFLEDHLPFVNEPDKPPILARIASLELILGRLRESSNHFAEAAALDNERDAWLLSSLATRFAMGEYATVAVEAGRLARTSSIATVRDEALALSVLSYYRADLTDLATTNLVNRINTEEAISAPLLLYVRGLVSGFSSSQGQNENPFGDLLSRYPDSAISHIVTSGILLWSSPDVLLHNIRQTQGVLLQVGAFRDSDRADQLQQRLLSMGMISWIETSGSLWIVIVNDTQGNAGNRLGQIGIESIPFIRRSP